MSAIFAVSSAKEASDTIASLARTHGAEVGPAVIQLLSELPGRSLALRVLVEIADALRPRRDELIAGYRAGYNDRPLPLGEDEARRFALAMALLDAFEQLYHHVLETALAAPSDDASRADAAAALQRSMATLVSQMIEHYRARQIVGLALWKKLQERMQLGVREKLDTVQVIDPMYPRGLATPHETYGRALLLSLAQAGAMTHRSLEATLALTAHFSDLVELAILDAKEGGPRASPPGGMAGVGIQRTGRIRVVAVGGVTHLVNTIKIDGALGWCVQRLGEGASPHQIGLSTVAQADLAGLLPRLRRIWCGAGEIREAAREASQGPSIVAIGFREISQFASGGPLSIPREFEVYSSQPSILVRSKQTLSMNVGTNAVESWETLDHSATGMRAKRSQPGAQLQRGQLLAVDLEGIRSGAGFALAEVRWLQQFTDSDAGGIAAGVRFLTFQARVAVVRTKGLIPGEYQTVGPTFVLDEVKPPRLVLPLGWFAPHRMVDLWYKNLITPLRLDVLHTRGADYEIIGYMAFPPLPPPKR